MRVATACCSDVLEIHITQTKPQSHKAQNMSSKVSFGINGHNRQDVLIGSSPSIAVKLAWGASTFTSGWLLTPSEDAAGSEAGACGAAAGGPVD